MNTFANAATKHHTSDTNISKKSYFAAYRSFLFDKDELLFLKIAPLLLIIGSPEIVLSNLIPVVGELLDVGGLTVTMIVVFKTLQGIKRHR